MLAAVIGIPWVCFYVWCLTRGHMQKYRKYAPVKDAVYALLGYLGTMAACQDLQGHPAICVAGAVLTGIMLSVSAREDLHTGQFYVLPLMICLLANLVIAGVCGRLWGEGSMDGVPLYQEAAVVAITLAVLIIGRLAPGDGFIYLACWLSFRILLPDASFPAYLLLLFISAVLGILTWVVRLFRGRSAGERFPFTAQIASGCLITYLLLGFFPAAGIQIY